MATFIACAGLQCLGICKIFRSENASVHATCTAKIISSARRAGNKRPQVSHNVSYFPTRSGFCLGLVARFAVTLANGCEHFTFPSGPFRKKRPRQASCTAFAHRGHTNASKYLHLDYKLSRRERMRYLNRAGSYSHVCCVIIA